MVDALKRAHRLLEPGGVVIDVHPTAADASVEVGAVRTGRVDAGDAPGRHAAAARALTAVVDAGLFAIDRTHRFTFYTYGDSVDELRDYIEGNWRNATMDDDTVRRTREALRADPSARPRVHEHVQVTNLIRVERATLSRNLSHRG
jgi:hypothetical protein